MSEAKKEKDRGGEYNRAQTNSLEQGSVSLTFLWFTGNFLGGQHETDEPR